MIVKITENIIVWFCKVIRCSSHIQCRYTV